MNAKQYPIGDYYKVLDGFDIHKSNRVWEAVVVVEDEQGRRHIRLYKWIERNGEWKVDLARFNICFWRFDEVSAKVKELKEKWSV